jgi:uncharacterized protein YkwD
MKRWIGLAAGIAMSVFAGAATAATSCVAPPNVNELATQIAAGLNTSRRANGTAPLRFNRQLGQAAMVHACDMLVNDFFDHRGSNGSNSQRRVRDTGYEDCIVAENIAWGYPQPAQIITGWMNSPGHRRNMLHPRVQEFGIGITQGPDGPYWVLIVGKQC